MFRLSPSRTRHPCHASESYLQIEKFICTRSRLFRARMNVSTLPVVVVGTLLPVRRRTSDSRRRRCDGEGRVYPARRCRASPTRAIVCRDGTSIVRMRAYRMGFRRSDVGLSLPPSREWVGWVHSFARGAVHRATYAHMIKLSI